MMVPLFGNAENGCVEKLVREAWVPGARRAETGMTYVGHEDFEHRATPQTASMAGF